MRITRKYPFASTAAIFFIAVAASACNDDAKSGESIGPTAAELEALRTLYARGYEGEESFSIDSLKVLKSRSAITVAGLIESVEPGPADPIATLNDGSTLYDETIAVTVRDGDGELYVMVTNYADATGFDAMQKAFPLGAQAVLFGVPYEFSPGSKGGKEFAQSAGSKWWAAHPLGFWIVDADGILTPPFATHTETQLVDERADVTLVNQSLGLTIKGIRWPQAIG